VGIGGPKSVLELFAADDFALIVNEDKQHLIDLALQSQFATAAIYLLALPIDLKGAKPHVAR
jgi:hypothetical protein